MKLNNIKLLKKLIFPLLGFSILTAIISIFSIFLFQQTHINHMANEAYEKTNRVFKKKFDNDILIYESLIKLISKDRQAIDYFLNQNREGLYQYYKNTYLEYQKKFNLSHFYFHKKDKINFLRVHNYKKHSDKIERETLKKSMTSKGLGSGIEFGIHHNLTLRVVYPWIVNKKIIGYIELGKEIDYFTPELSKMVNSEIIFTIEKNVISKKNYETWLEKSKNNTSFKELSKYYIVDSSIKKMSNEITRILNNPNNMRNIKVENNNKVYYANSVPFNNIKGNEIGKMFVFTDLSDEFDFLFKLIMNVTLVIGILFTLLLIYFSYIIKKEEKIINNTQNKTHSLAITDGLTSLYNRRYFDDCFYNVLLEGKVKEHYVSLLIIDIDNFKKYNDNYGHQAGDIVLKSVAETLKKSLRRENDKCFRIGGEEFGVILESAKEKTGKMLAEKIRENVEQLNIEHLYNEFYKKITISIGIYVTKLNHNEDMNFIYKKADQALYKAKDNGRNCVFVER